MTRYEPRYPSTGKDVNVGPTERLLSVLLGGYMAAKGVKKGKLSGMATALAGGYLMYRGSSGHCNLYERAGVSTARRAIEIDESVIINRPVHELYSYWRSLDNLPEFMRHIEEVRVIDDKRSHWVASTPGGIKVEWDAEITGERENEYIAWKSLPFSDIESEGMVEFRTAPGHRGTELRVHMIYNLPGDGAAAPVQRLLAAISFRQIREELRRFKQIMETGEAPTTEGQVRGRAIGE